MFVNKSQYSLTLLDLIQRLSYGACCCEFANRLFHRDRLSRNDVIGTTYLNLSKIASSGGEGGMVFLLASQKIQVHNEYPCRAQNYEKTVFEKF